MRFIASLGAIASAAAMALAHTSVAAQQQLQLAAASLQSMGADDMSFMGALATFNASPSFTSVLDAIGAMVSEVGPAQSELTFSPRMDYASISVSMPATTSKGLEPNRPFDITVLQTSGGLRIDVEDDETTNTGGSLVMSNLRVDLEGRKIHADLTGANGVGWQQQVHLWTFTNERDARPFGSPLPCQLPCLTDVHPDISLSGLVIQQPAFDLFTRSLGLTKQGIGALARVTDYGTLVVAVPEVSTVVQMGLGFAGLGLLAQRRRRRTTH